MLELNVIIGTKKNLIKNIPDATFKRGCSLPIRIKSAEFKLLKLEESSIGSCKYKYLKI
jgi:hypothetical protein